MSVKTIVDFANQVKSYALGIKDQQVLGAWNLLSSKFYATSGTDASQITWTDNGDGTVTSSGTATANSWFQLKRIEKLGIPTGTYWLTGCPAGGSASTYLLRFIDTTTNTTYEDYGNGVQVPIDSTHDYTVSCGIISGNSAPGLWKPMISTQKTPYVPYVMTNNELSEVKVVNASYTRASSTIKDISLDVQRVGKVVQFAIYFVTNASINAGATAELTLVNCPLPSYSGMRIIGFSGTYELIGWIESTGKVKIRFFGNTNEGASIVLSGIYLTND